ncbi:MAG: hypothetical protein HYR70_01535 [Chloroflexi bacterium]|nr:hypothetical protein [Chloroflexota bacterium]MBI1854590.1 hypothetical protein [Chloroflexota bacterium]MBI3341196.1 hypothetical protein [Chloroflexota bacterium]
MQNVNYTVNHFVHAYKQAPWRIQRQWIGAFLLGIFGLTLAAMLYLDITSQASVAGRNIQDMTAQITSIQLANSDLQNRLAEITSISAMKERALALGYQPIKEGQMEYVIVPGYAAPKPSILTASIVLKPAAPSQPAQYTQSLFEWLDERLRTPPSTSMIGITQ